jgi:GrpB-like predicted nucleotidyltransferase (UPF0157 family)
VSDEPSDPTFARLEKIVVGRPSQKAPVVLVEYDPTWPQRFALEQRRINAALGKRALRIEHVGSTSVPGLAAKPIIDMCVVVADSSDEASYVPDLESAGYVLRIREPDWREHRMLRDAAGNVFIHVFTLGSSEIARMVGFRDWLRVNEADRVLYESTKRELAQQDWPTVQHYADAKTGVVEEILARALRT